MVRNTVMEHEAPSNPFLVDGAGTVHTTSHLRMWQLTFMNGYQVVSTGLIPRSTVFGGIWYTRMWDLMPPKET